MRSSPLAKPTRYTMLGVDDEVTTCEHCGKSNLKCTVVLGALDADGNAVGDVRFGRDCAAAALGRRKGTAKAKADYIEQEARNAQAARIVAGIFNSQWARVKISDGRFPVWAYFHGQIARLPENRYLTLLERVTGVAWRYVGNHRGEAVYVKATS